MTHELQIRVYYEDTDLAGIVYYANYLKFIERARSEYLRDLGVDQNALKQDQNCVFAVRRVTADYLKPAKFDDLVTVHTKLCEFRKAQLTLSQDIWRGEARLFKSSVTLVALRQDGRPIRLPEALVAALS